MGPMTKAIAGLSALLSVALLAVGGNGAAAPATPAGTASPYVCHVTTPNRTQPEEVGANSGYAGNGQLWALVGDGIRFAPPSATPGIEVQLYWIRTVHGPLTVEARRLDAEAPTVQAHLEPAGDIGGQMSDLTVPSAGCWAVTGRADDANLTVVIVIAQLPVDMVHASPMATPNP